MGSVGCFLEQFRYASWSTRQHGKQNNNGKYKASKNKFQNSFTD